MVDALAAPLLICSELLGPVGRVPRREPIVVVADVDGGGPCVRRDRRRLLPPSLAGLVLAIRKMAKAFARSALCIAMVLPPAPICAWGA